MVRGLLTFLILLVGNIYGADCVMIVVCDTVAENIDDSVSRDLVNIREEGRLISQHTGMPLVEKVFTGETLDGEALLDYLRDLQVQADDFVFFYYSGHGYRTPAKGDDPWPFFYFTEEDEGLDYGQVIDILKAKNARLLLAIADCCNSEMEEDYAPVVIREKSLAKNYKKLFLKTSGEIIITSSEIGESSWALSKGGVYTLAFLDKLHRGVKKSKAPSWKTLLRDTSKAVRKYQTPYYEID